MVAAIIDSLLRPQPRKSHESHFRSMSSYQTTWELAFNDYYSRDRKIDYCVPSRWRLFKACMTAAPERSCPSIAERAEQMTLIRGLPSFIEQGDFTRCNTHRTCGSSPLAHKCQSSCDPCL